MHLCVLHTNALDIAIIPFSALCSVVSRVSVIRLLSARVEMIPFGGFLMDGAIADLIKPCPFLRYVQQYHESKLTFSRYCSDRRRTRVRFSVRVIYN